MPILNKFFKFINPYLWLMFSLANLITSTNVFLGSCAAVFILNGNYLTGIYCILGGLLADFLDGFVARKLKQSSDLGKELDSLADVITFGFVPGCIGFSFLRSSYGSSSNIPFIAFLLTVMAAFRLAKFNVLSDHSPKDFNGVPTPAMGLFFTGLLGIQFTDSKELIFLIQPSMLVFFIFLFSYLMLCPWIILKIHLNKSWIRKHILLLILYIVALLLSFKLSYFSLSLLVIVHIIYSLSYTSIYEKISSPH